MVPAERASEGRCPVSLPTDASTQPGRLGDREGRGDRLHVLAHLSLPSPRRSLYCTSESHRSVRPHVQ